MPSVATSQLFPSAAFISTNGKGDLQEVVGVDEAKAKLTHDGVTIEAVTAGTAGNALQAEIVENTGAGAIAASYDSSANKLTFDLPASAAATASLTLHGLTFTAATAGAAGNNIRVRFRVGQGVTGVVASVSGNDITIDSEFTTANNTQGDIETAFNAASITIASISVADSTAAMTSNIPTYTALASGSDAVDATSYTQQQLVDAATAAGSSVTDVFSVTAADGTANLTAALAATNLADGVDEVSAQLEKSEKYLLIKESDLYDLEDGEQSDGRKVLWGILHNASEVWANLASQPDSLKIARSAISSVDGGTALKQTYTISAKYAIGGLDLKAES